MKKNSICRADDLGGVDNSSFNFLENLLIFCPTRERRVPRETNVCFEVRPPAGKNCLTLLFKTDIKGGSPLVTEMVKRPDYICLYVDSEKAICTIIEMKSSDGMEAITQIKELHEILIRNMSALAPHKCSSKIRYQGVVVGMGRSSTQSSAKELIRLKNKKRLPIHFVNRNSPELFLYISKLNDELGITHPIDRTVDPKNPEFSPIENFLINDSEINIINDECKKKNWKPKNKRDSLYVNYKLSAKDFATLVSSNSGTTLFHPKKQGIPKQVINDLKSLVLDKYIVIESI